MDDIMHSVNGAKFFSKIDLNQGYHQVELSPESRHVTAFSTHKGIYQYKRLNFGINCSSGIYQNVIHQLLSGLPKQENLSDDIIVCGDSLEECDRNTTAVLRRLEEQGCTVNEDKCEFCVPELVFFGLKLSSEGSSLAAVAEQ